MQPLTEDVFGTRRMKCPDAGQTPEPGTQHELIPPLLFWLYGRDFKARKLAKVMTLKGLFAFSLVTSPFMMSYRSTFGTMKKLNYS